MYVMLGIAVVVWAFFRYAGLGRRILAIGSNMHAAELYGISVKGTTITAHIFSGILAAAAAILLVARIGSAQTDIGSDWMMFSFAAPIIGGTRQAGGKVNVPGAVVGAVVLSIIANALVHLKIDVYWMTFIQGCIILLAVTVDRLRYINVRRVA
jgi:ribose transport system permease protein